MVKVSVTRTDDAPKRRRNNDRAVGAGGRPAYAGRAGSRFQALGRDGQARAQNASGRRCRRLPQPRARTHHNRRRRETGPFRQPSSLVGECRPGDARASDDDPGRHLAVPADVQVVPVHLDSGFIIDIQIPRHRGGPFMNRFNGSYLVRSGARNLPIDPACCGAASSTSWPG